MSTKIRSKIKSKEKRSKCSFLINISLMIQLTPQMTYFFWFKLHIAVLSKFHQINILSQTIIRWIVKKKIKEEKEVRTSFNKRINLRKLMLISYTDYLLRHLSLKIPSKETLYLPKISKYMLHKLNLMLPIIQYVVILTSKLVKNLR